MTFLLALEDNGIGALFFAHAQEEKLRLEFQLPNEVQILGTVALGYATEQEGRQGRSADRQRKTVEQVIHRSQW
jgi:nitroreductase